MIVNYKSVIFLALCIWFKDYIDAEVRFTNLVCKSNDEDFVTFEHCFLKSINRTYRYLSIKAKLLKKPIANITMNLAFLKRENGYKPFLYNVTVDACKYLRQKNPNPVVKFIHGLFRSYSNLNHTCPYDHDLIVEKLDTSFLDIQLTKLLPFPKGDYAMDTNWFVCNVYLGSVRAYYKLN